MARNNEFDAIVVGSGISGGWAAKELCEKGLKTLVLERGRKLDHVIDYETTNTPPWEFKHRGKPTKEDKDNYPEQSKCFAFNEGTKNLWINDKENPYTTPEGQKFSWIRGNHVGGKSIMWWRQSYRLSDLDFEANAKDGHGEDWPVRYNDIAPWYDYVDRFIGVSGSKEKLPQLPDGEFLPPFEMTCYEKYAKNLIEEKWPNRKMIIGRTANLTQNHNGRSRCMNRDLCVRGCPFGAYFSSQSSTLPAATKTGNLTLKPDSLVASVLYDTKNDKATGVRVINTVTKKETEYTAKVIFLCASTLGSAQILLNSANARFTDALANSSGQVGKNLMCHNYGSATYGIFEGLKDKYYFGGRPNGIYVPRFRNMKEQHPDFVRGYAFAGGGIRAGWDRGTRGKGFGPDFKVSLSKPGPWIFMLFSSGETLPDPRNQVTLNKSKIDKLGLPVLHIDMKFRENEINMKKDFMMTAEEIERAAGCKEVFNINLGDNPGLDIHEMGTARMGHDPKTSVLNKWNQCHDIKNLFITDGSFMASSACQNPSLTYMAFTARAVDYCVKEMKKGNIR